MQKNICALVIDDDGSIRNLLSVILRTIGVDQVLTASEGQEALNIISDKGANTNLVICDMMMPGMDGLTFLDKFRPIKPDVPVVMLSGKSDAVTFHKAKLAGADYYLTKPIDPPDFIARIQSIIQMLA